MNRQALALPDTAAVVQRRALLLAELARIGKMLARDPSIRQILLFGSVAAGNVHEWSDLDLLVVQDTDASFLERSRRLTTLTRPKVGTQFLVYTPGELATIASRPFVRDEVLQKGKILPMDPKTDAERWLAFATDDVRMARSWGRCRARAPLALPEHGRLRPLLGRPPTGRVNG